MALDFRCAVPNSIQAGGLDLEIGATLGPAFGGQGLLLGVAPPGVLFGEENRRGHPCCCLGGVLSSPFTILVNEPLPMQSIEFTAPI